MTPAQDILIGHVRRLVSYWRRLPENKILGDDEITSRLNGLAFSFLVMIDGFAGGIDRETVLEAMDGDASPLHILFSEEEGMPSAIVIPDFNPEASSFQDVVRQIREVLDAVEERWEKTLRDLAAGQAQEPVEPKPTAHLVRDGESLCGILDEYLTRGLGVVEWLGMNAEKDGPFCKRCALAYREARFGDRKRCARCHGEAGGERCPQCRGVGSYPRWAAGALEVWRPPRVTVDREDLLSVARGLRDVTGNALPGAFTGEILSALHAAERETTRAAETIERLVADAERADG